MTILRTVHELHKKLSSDRFSDEISFEEFLNKYEGELCVISEQTGLNASAAMLLAGIIIATVSDPLPKTKFLINASRIARELSVFKFEVLLNHRLFTTLVEKGFIEIAAYYLEELNEDSAFTLRPGIPSKIKFLNKKFELTDDLRRNLWIFKCFDVFKKDGQIFMQVFGQNNYDVSSYIDNSYNLNGVRYEKILLGENLQEIVDNFKSNVKILISKF